MDSKIEAILIDSSIFCKVQCDFEGLTNSIIPKFFQFINKCNIDLLTHSILEGEINKHILESKLVEGKNNLKKALARNSACLKFIGIDSKEIINKLNSIDIPQRIKKARDLCYQKAITLPYTEAEYVFMDYFNNRPPFNKEKKKSEFPDAFILKSLETYHNLHPEKQILVVSGDEDWASVCNEARSISILQTLEEAFIFLSMQYDDKTDLCEYLISQINKTLRTEIEEATSNEAFCVEGICSSEVLETEIDNVKVISLGDEIVPLEVTDTTALLQITASISSAGNVSFLNDDKSAWDSEDRCYIFPVYTRLDFHNARAEVKCEVKIEYTRKDNSLDISLGSLKLLNIWDIAISLEEASTEETDITDYYEEEYVDFHV